MMATSAACPAQCRKPARQQHRRRNRAGPGDQRDRQREGGDVVDMVPGDGDVGDLLLAVLALLENHFEGDEEQQKAAGDAERRQRDAEHREDRRAGDGKQRHHREADDGGADRDLPPLLAVHAARHRQEKRRQPRRIDRHENGDEGIEKAVVARHRGSLDGKLARSSQRRQSAADGCSHAGAGEGVTAAPARPRGFCSADTLSQAAANADIHLNFRQKSVPEKAVRHWRISRLSYIRHAVIPNRDCDPI